MPGSTEKTVGLGSSALRRASARTRLLVGGEADPVAEAVAVRRPGRVGVDHGAGDGVQGTPVRDRAIRNARPQLVDQHCLKRRARTRSYTARSRAAGAPHEQRPGHVAPVALDLGPEVEQEDLAGPYKRHPGRPVAAAPPPGRRGRRRRMPGPPRLRSASAGHFETQGEIVLGHPGPDLGQQRRQRPVVARRAGRRAVRSILVG